MVVKAPTAADRLMGNQLRIRRKLLGMSQEKLAEAVGLTFQQIQKYEKGTNRISASRLQQIASVLKVPVTFFYESAAGDRKPEEKDIYAEFLSGEEGQKLIRAFAQIKDKDLQRLAVDLVVQLAKHDTRDRSERLA